MRRVLRLASFLVLAFLACGKASSRLSGKTVAVHDGDSITILVAGNRQVKVRLYGIDAPEFSQAFGTKAKMFLSSLVFGRDVRVLQVDTDRYGRVVGNVYLDPDALYVNAEVVRAGFAWHFICYASGDEELARLEREARSAHRGLWAEPGKQCN